MRKIIYLGSGKKMIPIPAFLWKMGIASSAKKADKALGYLSREDHLVRDFVVREIPRRGKPLPPRLIAKELGLPLDRVTNIIDKLEKRMIFLFRNEDGDVEWAYPVTADATPHRVVFDTGEETNAA